MCDLDSFWDIIEKRISCTVPKYIRNILKLNGYENAVSIRTITVEDIDFFQHFARNDMAKRLPKDHIPEEYYGCFSETPQEFEFLRGHRKLLEEIVVYINEEIASKGRDFFSVQPKMKPNKVVVRKSYQESLFSPFARKGATQSLNSTSTSTSTHLSTTLPATTSNRSLLLEKEMISLRKISISSESSKSNVQSPNHNEVQDLVESSMIEPLSQQSNVDVRSNNQFNDFEISFIEPQRQHVFKNVMAWMSKNARSVYEEHSDRLTSEMVQIMKNKQTDRDDNEDDEGDDEEDDEEDVESVEKKLVDSLSASVRCPVCLDLIAVTKAPNVLTSGISVNYFLLSNFFKHLKKHLKETSMVPKRKLRDRNSATDQKTIVGNVKRVKSDLVLPKVKPSVRGAKPSKRKTKTQVDSSSDENQLDQESDDFDEDFDEDTNIDLSDDSTDQLILTALVASAKKNALRSKPGYRHDILIKAFACYIKMLAGLLAYETLHANLPLSLPSVSTVNRFIKDKGPMIVEGESRSNELIKYLLDRKLPLRISLSEDATRITPKITYDVNTNQLVGFALPLDQNGMPITLSFEAKNAKQIQGHFINPNNFVSSNVIVQMAQPQSLNVPPFCLNLFLTDNSYKAEHILSRWNFTTKYAQDKGLTIDNYASDGDPRCLKVMKFKSQLGINDLCFFNCEWYSCGNMLGTTYTQDTHHIGTKERNRVLKVSRVTPIGSKIISITHLIYLMENVSKDRHLLTPNDVNPKDRQNFHSVEKICAEKVIACLLKYVPDSEGTAIFLKALNYSIYSFLDTSMSPAERIYKIWYAIFFYRGWRSWLLKSKQYTLKESFISLNCYTCIELNGHTLVKQILKSIKDPTYSFLPYKQGSQPCESTFRQIRSMTSTFSTVVNCSMIDIIHRMKKIQLQSDIIHECRGKIQFPRLDRKESKTRDADILEFLPNEKEIIVLIEQAKADVITDLSSFEIDTNTLDFHCHVKATKFKTEFHYEDIDDAESDDEFDLDDNDENSNIEEIEGLEDDLQKISGLTGELIMKDYSKSETDVDEEGPFAMIEDSNGRKIVVRKTSICWLLSIDKYKLSSDRIQRVMEKDFQQNRGKGNLQVTQELVENEEIRIGEWCIFEIDSSLVAGLILSFCYTAGTSLKTRSYTKSTAPTHNAKPIGVLGSWYSWDKDGKLTRKDISHHSFVEIEKYKGTIFKPSYSNKQLSLSQNVVNNLFDLEE